MKQSKKLLSILLAIIMMFGVVSVGASAFVGVKPADIKYDARDDAALTPEQCAVLLLDFVESDLLAGMKPVDLSILGELRLDTIDHIFADLRSVSTNFLINTLIGGDGQTLVDAVKEITFNSSAKRVYTRSQDGSLTMVKQVLDLLGRLSGIVKKAPYGLLDKNGIEVGGLNGIISGVVGDSLDDINNTLKGLDKLLIGLVYDALIYGSYDYSAGTYKQYDGKKWDKIEGNKPFASLDTLLNTAIVNLLITPQDYKYEGEGEAAVKVWDQNSVISKTLKAEGAASVLSKFNLNQKSILQILDTLLPYAYNEFGIHGLNVTLKRVIMEAMGADLNEIDYAELPAAAQSAFGTEVSAAYCNYAMKDNIINADGKWYYTDVRSRAVDLNSDGVVDETDVDEDGNQVKMNKRVYFEIDLSAANDLVDLVNWDYSFDETSFGTADSASGIAGCISTYGSVFGSLNHLVYLIAKEALNPAALGAANIDALWTDGDNSKLDANLISVARKVVVTYTKTIFGRGSEYVDQKTGKITAEFKAVVEDEKKDLVDLVEYIGLPLFGEAMPQLVLPTPKGTNFCFDDGVQLFEFGAIVIREFLTDITPNVNYDDVIFEAGTLTSATGRQMADHTADEWYNIILNMGLDLAFTYLPQITNFSAVIPAKAATNSDRWLGMLDTIVTWGANYIGSGSSGALKGLDPNTIASKGNAFQKLDYALNTLLPLGFISDCSGNGYDFDLEALLLKVKGLATNLKLAPVVALFGRNTAAADGANPNGVNMGNILSKTNVVTTVLNLAQRILYLVAGQNLIPDTSSCDKVITRGKNASDGNNIGTLAQNLLNGLNARKDDLLNNLLPVVLKFIADFGGEQKMASVSTSIADTVYANGSNAVSASFDVNAKVKGLWRGYRDDRSANTWSHDEQYNYKIKSVSVKNLDGSASGFSASVTGTEVKYGGTAITGTVTGTATQDIQLVKLVTVYNIYTGTTQLGGDFKFEEMFAISKAAVVGTKTRFFSFTAWMSGLKTVGEADSYSPYYVNIAGGAAGINGAFYNINEDGTNGSAKIPAYIRHNNRGGDIYKERINVASTGGVQHGFNVPTTDNEKVNENGITTYVAFDKAAYEADPAASGDVLTWSLKGGTAEKISDSGDNNTGYVKLYLYNDNERTNLLDLVKDEYALNRQADAYTEGFEAYTAALDAAAKSAFVGGAGMQVSTNRDYNALKEALKAAIEALVEVEDSSSSSSSSSSSNTLNTAALKTAREAAEEALNGKGYTDFYLYRWDRYRDVTKRADGILNAEKNAKAAVQTQYWSYNDAVAGDKIAGYAAQVQAANANYKADYVNALATAYDADELAALHKQKESAEINYNRYTQADIDDTTDLLPKMAARLIARETAPADGLAFLNTEIASAEAQFKSQGNFSAKSWARYTAALQAAKAATTSNSNTEMFNAKYELLVARNNLRTAAEEASYVELENLIAQAQGVFANAAFYDNTNLEFGKVLAALGVAPVTKTEDGKTSEINLFPNAAINVLNNSYAADDQKKVDRAADALRAALAALKFKDATVKKDSVEVVPQVITQDAEGNDVTELFSQISDKLLDAAAVKKHFTASITGISSDKVTSEVSPNATYAIANESSVFVGTGSTITFYAEVNGTRIPFKTVKIVIDGDVNGDGTVDVLDASQIMLVSNGHAELNGLFFVAGNLDTATEGIDANDYAEVVNKALA